MPIVTEPILVDFQGRADDIMADVKKINASFDQFAAKNKEIERASISAARTSKNSWTEFRSAYSTVLDVVRVGGQVFQATFGKFQSYAQDVRDLSIASGTGAKEASTLIQVLDDFQVSASDISTAARAMKENGIVPTVESLADLADKFVAIKDPAKRLEFAQDNLGRSYNKYLNVLSKGGDVLRNNAELVNKNLILTDEQIKKAELERLAIDELSDAWQGLGVQAGAFFGQLILNTSNHKEVVARLKEQGIEVARGVEHTKAYKDELAKLEEEQLAVSKSSGEVAEGVEGTVDSMKEAEEIAKRLSNTYGGLLSSMFSIQAENEKYTDTIDDLNKSDEELLAKKQQLTLEWYQQQQAGTATAGAMLEYMQAIDEVTRAEEENAQARLDLEADREKASKQREYDLAKERLSVDGLTSAEFEGLQTVAVQKGLVSRAAADQAIAESKAADMIIESMGATVVAMHDTEEAMTAIRALGGMVPFGVNYTSNVPGANYGSFNAQASPGGYGYAASRDSGGSGVAGQAYMIGAGAQPEMFIPNTNGTFVPNADKKIGATYNITINNPVPAKSEDDILKASKLANATGRWE